MSNDSNFLFEILGIAIGFSGFILLLSLLVTSISQIVQSLLSLRYFNLRNGWTHVLNEVLFEGKQFQKAKEIVARVLQRPVQIWLWRGGISSPGVTWMAPEEFARKTIEDLGKHTDDKEIIKARDVGPHAIKKRVLETEAHLRERFQAWMRVVSVAVALIIALFFQVDSLDLLKQLSVDPELREEYDEIASAQLSQSEQILAASRRYDFVSDSALATLSTTHPELREVFEEASGIGSGKDEITGELSLILTEARVPNAEAIVAEYRDTLESYYSRELSEAVSTTVTLLGQTSFYRLSPFPQGSAFYCSFANWVGVLVTTILMSLGAPFWFETLRKLTSLRDQLRASDLDKRQKEENTK